MVRRVPSLPGRNPHGLLVNLPASTRSPVVELSRRLLIALGLLTLMVMIVVVDRDGYKDTYDGHVGLIDSIYYATVTLTTTGYGDITPVTPTARLVNAFVVTPLRISFLVVLVGTTLEVLANEGRRVMRDTRWRKRMKDHVVVVGYGTKGRAAVQTLLSNGVKREDIVVIDPRAQAIGDAGNDQMAAFHGDATNRTVLRRAEVMTAREVIVTTDRDDSAVLVTLAVRQLNPNAHIVVAVREEDNVPLLRQSGADAVVTSSEAVGRLLGLSAVSPNLGEVMEDLLTYGEGLEVAERPVLGREVGKAPSSVPDRVVSVVRDGKVHRYYDSSVSVLAAGDKLIVVRPAKETPWAERPGADDQDE
ncbi:potassium channel family protein [Kribbella catacumbae]|uniref:potassium channel family protein n=1 Tax=Kribbella catacumbae TaxID=460086 RepID=UPI003B50CA45